MPQACSTGTNEERVWLQRRRLVEHYVQTVRRYEACVRDLARIAGTGELERFCRLKQRCIELRQACHAVRQRLDSEHPPRIADLQNPLLVKDADRSSSKSRSMDSPTTN